MSSIAYISDEKMIEHHRTEGNRSINFWRLSLKSFERFQVGDLLFFLDKRHIHPNTKEKGIIGYGRAHRIRTMSVKRTWDEYGSMNGFSTYLLFKEAILNLTKHHSIPKQIQSIELNNVVFFKAPIYLSEVNFDLTKRLESFVYLDNKYEDVSLEILDKASKIGIDSWFNTIHQNNLTQDSIIESMNEQKVRAVLSKVNVDMTHLQMTMLKRNPLIRTVESLGYVYHGNKFITLYIPCSSVKNQFFEIIGINQWIKKELEDYKFTTYVCIKDSGSQEEYEAWFTPMNLKLEYI